MNRLLFLFLLLAPSLMAQPAPFLRNSWTTNAAGTPVQGQDNLSVTNLGSGTNWLFHSVRPQTIARLIDITNVVTAIGGGTNYWTNDPPGYLRPVTLTNNIWTGTNKTSLYAWGDVLQGLSYWAGGPVYNGLSEMFAADEVTGDPSGYLEKQMISLNSIDGKVSWIDLVTSVVTNSTKNSVLWMKTLGGTDGQAEIVLTTSNDPTIDSARESQMLFSMTHGTTNASVTYRASAVTSTPLIEASLSRIETKKFLTCSTNGSNVFVISNDGNVDFLRRISYSWPTAQGAAQSVLTNNGAGVLGWGTAASGGGAFNINQFEASATHTNIKSAALLTNIVSRNITNAGVSVTMASGVELRWPGFTLLENVPGGAQLILNGQFNAIGAVDLDSTLLVNGVGTFDTNVSVLGTNDSRYLKLSGGVPGSSILRTDSNTNVVAATIGSGLSFDGTTLSSPGGALWTNDPAGYLRPTTVTNSIYTGTNQSRGYFSGDLQTGLSFWGAPSDGLQFFQTVDGSLRANARLEGLVLAVNPIDSKNAYLNWNITATTNLIKRSQLDLVADEGGGNSSSWSLRSEQHPTSVVSRNAKLEANAVSGSSNASFIIKADTISADPLLRLTTVGVNNKFHLICQTNSSNVFRISDDGNIANLRRIAYSWPTAQGAAQSVLTNDGNGVLGWGAGGGGSGEINVNGEVSITNSTRMGWVYDKVGVTNRLRSIQGGNGITLTNEGTNIMVALTFDPQPASTTLTNLSGTGAITNLFSPTLSNATIKPLVVGAGDAAGATNTTGHIRGLEAGANITITPNGSNYVIASTATGGGITSNANQFGVSVELTIKSGALLTNVLLYPSNLTGPATIHLATTAQVTNLTEWRGTNGVVGLAISSNGLALVQERLDLANAVAFRTNNIDFRLNTYQAFTASLKTNLVLQLTNTYEGVTTRLDAYGAGRLGGGATNAWQLLCTVASGVNIYWPPGTTNGNYDVLVNSNQVVSFTFMGGLGSTNILASYRVLEGIGAN